MTRGTRRCAGAMADTTEARAEAPRMFGSRPDSVPLPWKWASDRLPGPFYEVKPRVAFGWISDDTGLDGGAAFGASATRWSF
jgi:hypothetical protein